ncbi:MAG: FkbM family methyltransferase [Tannerella sp.]|jgi:FkbM family methyltransferase|nr:FkbM family methyltransferase [Tannerella sp.]
MYWKNRIKKTISNSGVLKFLYDNCFLETMNLLFNKREKRHIKVVANEMAFEVIASHYRIWNMFNSEKLEPETFDFYRKYVSPEKEVIDIGGWIGTTVMIAYSLNARKISVVEADPENFQILKRNCMINYLNDKVELFNICISEKTGDIVGFGFTDVNNKDTSTKSIGGERKVVTTSLVDFLSGRNLNNTNIIKIDIEGAEQVIDDGLDYISGFPGIIVLLSMHTVFWDDKAKTTERLIPAFRKFDVYSDKEESISEEELKIMMLAEDKSPTWDDRTGRFFTLILKTK